MLEMTTVLGRVEQWLTLAQNDIRLRYRRTTLGPLWITLGLGATVLSVGILYGGLFGAEYSHYLPYFTASLIAWTFLSSTISEGGGVFLVSAALIRAVPVPLVVYVYRLVARQLMMMGHNFLIVVVLWLVFRWPLSPTFLLVIPGLILNAGAALGMVLCLSVVAARFRDLQLIVATILQLIFLLTPIMWETKVLKTSAFVVDFNPFYHLIEVVRAPILGQMPAPLSWGAAIVTVLIAMAIGVYFYARYRHRVPFWV